MVNKKNITLNGLNINSGKTNFGVLLILLVAATFSIFLVFSNLRLSPLDNQLQSTYTCCDSGDGSLCQPIQSDKLLLNVDNYTQHETGYVHPYTGYQEYQLLKTGIKLAEGGGHLQPMNDDFVKIPASSGPQLLKTVKPGQHIYLSTAQAKWFDIYLKMGIRDQCELQGQPAANPKLMRDSIFYKNREPGYRSCAAIPDDELVYLCTSGCDSNGQPMNDGSAGIFNAYFRVGDLNDNPGIPDAIKNCAKPKEADIQQGRQRIINLPRPSSKPNLQLETFWITNDQISAAWVSPYCKPAVYLYPEEKSEVHVSLKPVGRLTYTIPRYPESGWEVTAYPDGSINEGGNWYDYLYYEAEIPDKEIRLPEEGYVISYGELRRFLPELVKGLGLNERETKEFSGYWLKVLPEARYYEIKVVSEEELGRISPLDILPRPDTSIRVTIHFEARDSWKEMGAPRVDTPRREGFTVVEWGGIFKRDAKHPFSCLM